MHFRGRSGTGARPRVPSGGLLGGRFAHAALLTTIGFGSLGVGSGAGATALGGPQRTGHPDTVRTRAQRPTRQVALLGDSILTRMGQDIAAGRLGGIPDIHQWTIGGHPGAGWGAGIDAAGQWPLNVVRGSWAEQQVSSLTADRPRALVVELGTNDALRAAFADAESDGALLAARRAGTEHNIARVLAEAEECTPCIVLVTPSSYPTPLFGGGRLYSEEAGRVAQQLRRDASESTEAATLIADWSAESASHHLGTGAAGNWFPTSDEIHPNLTGERQLAGLIESTLGSCPAGPGG